MKRMIVLTAIALAVTGVGAQQGRQGGTQTERDVMGGWNGKTPWGPNQRLGSGPKDHRDPFKIFDNVWYVGLHSVSSYLITTSAGLVLIDATYAETADQVISSVRKAGFDPANIKYILITHSHTDHFGGAGKIQQVTGARVGMSDLDWGSAIEQQGRGGRGGQSLGVPLKRDLVLEDNGSLKVGDTTFKFYITPGHTVGATSMEFQVKDRGKSYRALAPGGFGLTFGPAITPIFLKSVERTKQLGPWDVILGNHPFLSPRDMEREIEVDLAKRGSGNGPNPAVAGPKVINDWLDALLKVVHEKMASEQQAQR